MHKSCLNVFAAPDDIQLRGHGCTAVWLYVAALLVSLLGIPATAHAKIYFDFRSSTGTAITTQGDGTVCVADRVNCKYVVINLGHPTADILGAAYYQLNATNFNIMGGGCTSGALDIAVYNDVAYTSFDHQFGLAGSGGSPLPASSGINFSVPATKFAQLIFGCNDGGVPPVATIDGAIGTYQPRDINSITYSGLPNLCIGDTPADCGGADATVLYRQTFVNVTGNGNGNVRFVVNDANGLATHAFWWQQQNGSCTPTPQDGEFAFYLGGQLSNYFYVQNCDGTWIGDGQYHWTMYDFSGNSPCGGFRGPCSTFSFGDWAANGFFILGGGGGAYLDPQGRVTPALVLQGDTTPPADPQGLPITISHADALLIEDDTTGWSAGTDFHPIFSPFTLSPPSTLYHAQSSFTISRIHIGLNSDGSSNNHDELGNVRAWIFSTSGTLIGSSTNTCYGEGGCGNRDLVFPPATLAPQDFILTFITDDGLQADAGWGISHIGIYAEDPHPTISSISQFSGNGITTISEGGTAFGSAVIIKGTLQSASNDPLALQIEVEPFETPFINIGTITSAGTAVGQTTSLTVTGLNPGQYHWRARAIDLTTLIASPWQEFGSPGNVDFVVEAGPPPPAITSMTPNHGTRGQVIPSVIVSGSNFQPGTVISFSEPGVEVLSYFSRTSSQIAVSLFVSSAAPLGNYDLTVTNPDSQNTSASNAFAVSRRPVVVIPGIMGSVLEASDTGEVIWLNATETLSGPAFDSCDDFLLPLTLGSDGSSPAPQFTFSCGFPHPEVSASGTQVKPTELLTGSTVLGFPEHATDVYSKLLAALSEFPVTPFPYDWRLDYRTIAKQLRIQIEQLAPNPWDHVDIVSHSQGGLITQTYLALNQVDTRIGNVIYLGAPHLGATKAFAALKAWQDYAKFYDDSLFPSTFLNFNTMVFTGRTFPSLYELLPQYNFFQTDQTEEPFTTTYNSSFGPGLQPLVSNAESLWNLLQNATPPPVSVAINGSGFNTLFKLQKQSGSDCLIPINDPSGDGTVPLVSADALVNTVNFFTNVTHGELPNDATVTASVVKLLDGIDPFQLLELGLSATPSKAADSIRGYTCSPVVMTVTDAAGNTDGFDKLGHLLRQIPNSDFFSFDSTEGALLPSQAYQVNLSATNAGTFSVVFDFFASASNIITRSVQFQDVPISFASRARLTLTTNSSPSTLQLDIAGNGTPDFVITEGQTPPPSSFIKAIRDVLVNFGLSHNVFDRLEDILNQVAKLEREGDCREARKKLLHFDEEIRDLAGKQLSVTQAQLVTDMIAKAIMLLPRE